MHPADWKKMTPEERSAWAISAGTEWDWRVIRVAELTGVDADLLDWTLEAEWGWEPHDVGYLHQAVRCAASLLKGET